MEHFQKLKIANEILDYLASNKNCGLFPTIQHTGKIWQRQAAAMRSSTEIKEITISELMKLTDSELLELHQKVLAAKKAKQVNTRSERYFLK